MIIWLFRILILESESVSNSASNDAKINIFRKKRFGQSWDPYESLHVSHNQRCSQNVTTLADIFTVGRPKKVRRKPKSLAQMVEGFGNVNDTSMRESFRFEVFYKAILFQ